MKEIDESYFTYLFIIDTLTKSKTISEIDGHNSILYWADLTTEIAFYLPHYFTGKNFVLKYISSVYPFT